MKKEIRGYVFEIIFVSIFLIASTLIWSKMTKHNLNILQAAATRVYVPSLKLTRTSTKDLTFTVKNNSTKKLTYAVVINNVATDCKKPTNNYITYNLVVDDATLTTRTLNLNGVIYIDDITPNTTRTYKFISHNTCFKGDITISS